MRTVDTVFSRFLFGGLVAATFGLMATGCSGGDSDQNSNLPSAGGRRVIGATQTVSGAAVTSWATLGRNNIVTEVGVTLPLAVVQNPPAQPGTGPSGAIAVLPFPAEVQQSTYFNHFELQWVPEGHPPGPFLGFPHFDLHFYAVPESEVRAIAPGVDPAPPAANRIPQGYVYPGPNALVPEMGVHATAAAELAPGAPPFSTSMILGYYNGSMTFLEPMITQARLLQKQNITLDVPRPAVLGRATRYPTRMTATYDAATNSYAIVFRDFVAVTQ